MTNEVLELSRAVVDCMAGAAQVRSALVSKIASLQDEVERLQRNAVDGNTVKQLVGALASTGTIDRFNEAYFQKCASDENAGQALARIVSMLPKNATKAASASPSPFQVDTTSGASRAENSGEAAFSRKLAGLAKRA